MAGLCGKMLVAMAREGRENNTKQLSEKTEKIIQKKLISITTDN